MMNGNDLLNLIQHVDRCLRSYAADFASVKTNINATNQIQCSILNERTVSSFCNRTIADWLHDEQHAEVFYADEFYIVNGPGKTGAAQINAANAEVAFQGNINKKYKLNYVDGFIYAKNLYYPGDNYLFIEYKLNIRFVFASLATDYLKYKLYTAGRENNTVFAFVIADKKDNYPTIANTKLKYQLIGKTISKPLSDSRVFLYLPNRPGATDQTGSSMAQKDKQEAYRLLARLADDVDKLNSLSFEGVSTVDRVRELLSLNKRMLTKSVLEALVIQKNYPFIQSLLSACDNNKSLQPLVTQTKQIMCDLNSEEGKGWLNDALDHFSNIIHKRYQPVKETATRDGLNGHYRPSLYLLVFLDFFNEKYRLIDMKPEYDDKVLGRRKNAVSVSLEEFAERTKSNLREAYSHDEVFDRHVYALLYMAVMYYSLVFEIDSSGKIIKVKDCVSADRVFCEMQTRLTKLKKLCGYPGKVSVREAWESKNDLSDFFKFILERVSQ